MKWLADQIRQIGFRPGLWTVSFGTGDEAFYKAHQEWFLHHPNGQPMRNWNGRYVLDPSQAAVRKVHKKHKPRCEVHGRNTSQDVVGMGLLVLQNRLDVGSQL